MDARTVDAGSTEPDASDASGFDASVCRPGEDCECLASGSVRWGNVWYCLGFEFDRGLLQSAGDTAFCSGPWGDRIRIEARCPGEYRFCADVVSDSPSGCAMIEDVCTSGRVDETGRGVMPAPPGWVASNGCVEGALRRWGGRTCVSVSWKTADGRTGRSELGCFARFGPIGDGGRGGGGGGGGGSGGGTGHYDGEWDF